MLRLNFKPEKLLIIILRNEWAWDANNNNQFISRKIYFILLNSVHIYTFIKEDKSNCLLFCL